MRLNNKHHLFISFALLLLVALLTLPAVYNLFRPGFFATHDGEWMIIRFSAFYDAFREGQFPVRWLGRLNSMYGYPAPNFAYPLFMYLAAPIHAIGFGIVNSVKILTIGSFVASSIFTYLWLKKFFRVEASVLGSLAYTYTPYHVFNLYTRGSVGELVAMAVLPFVLWQIERRSILFTGIGIGLLMVSHNILAFLYLPVIVCYLLLRSTWPIKLRDIVVTFIPVVLGIALSSFFFIPALYDLRYIIFEKAKLAAVTTNFVSVDLFGIASFLFLIVTAGILFSTFKRHKVKTTDPVFRLFILFFITGLVTWFLTNPISTGVWEFLPTTLLQYPFRLLCLLPICIAFLAAYSLNLLKRYTLFIAATIGVLLFASAIPYLTPKEFFDRGDMYYANNFATTTVSNEYTPRWVEKQIFHLPDAKVKVSTGEIQNLVYNSRITDFTLSTTQSAKVQINTTYFPGWHVYVNNKEVPVQYHNTYGVMTFTLPAGNHTIAARFFETPLRIGADMLSIIALIVLLAFSFVCKTLPIQKIKEK